MKTSLIGKTLYSRIPEILVLHYICTQENFNSRYIKTQFMNEPSPFMKEIQKYFYIYVLVFICCYSVG